MTTTTEQKITLVYVHRDGREELEDISDKDLEKDMADIKARVQAQVMFSHSLKSAHILVNNEEGPKKILI